MSNNTILMALERMGYKGTMTGHGFRGLASTILHEQGYGHDHMLFAPFLELAASARSGTSWISVGRSGSAMPSAAFSWRGAALPTKILKDLHNVTARPAVAKLRTGWPGNVLYGVTVPPNVPFSLLSA
jgi:hypothetical protein